MAVHKARFLVLFIKPMAHSSSLPSALVSHSSYLRHKGLRAVGRTSVETLSVPTTDIQMRFVAEIESAYWHAHFSKLSFYVAGRSYDQYEPAFKLGWESALQKPDASFEDFLPWLESQWMAQRTSSLLPWREVHTAIKAAWMHARVQMQTLHERKPTMLCGQEVMGVLQSLRTSCLVLSAELKSFGGLAATGSLPKIMGHHARLMQNFVRGLEALGVQEASIGVLPSLWSIQARGQWILLKLRLMDSPADFLLARCEQRERGLLTAYQDALRKNLPQDAKGVLQHQSRQLQAHLNTLCWTQKNHMI